VRSRFQTLILLIGVAAATGSGLAQWRHFGEKAPVLVPAPAPVQVLPPPVKAPAPEETKSPVNTPVAGVHSPLENEMIAAHDDVRKGVGVGKLVWSDQLAAVAQEWADKLKWSGQFEHSRNPIYGENLYEIRGGLSTPQEVVNAWAGEAKDYNYGSNICYGDCRNYLQIVWGTTREIGCAVAQRDEREVWVCEYNPPGNYANRKPY
jgi:pathogenesis-related protein 1